MVADGWLRTLAGLEGHDLKVSFARHELERRRLGELAEGLEDLCRRAEQSEVAARDALGAFVPLVVDVDRLVQVRSLRATAMGGKMLSLSRLLRASTPAGHLLDRQPPSHDEEVPQRDDGRQLTLGERRALARQPSRATLDQLLRDPHPMVVRLVLKNPRITEPDVVQMAAHRPANAAVVVEIGKAWSQRARVRLALVQNPGAPPAVAVPMLPLMTRTELERIARATNLLPVVRATARELVALRPPLADLEPPEMKH